MSTFCEINTRHVDIHRPLPGNAGAPGVTGTPGVAGVHGAAGAHYLTESVYTVVLQLSIPAQIRQLILYYY